MSGVYEQSFFAGHLEGSRASAAAIVPLVVNHLSPSSVLDVGCGSGGWLERFQEEGITDCLGVDGYADVAESLVISKQQFRQLDLSRPFDLHRRFDLVVSLEVAEHLSEDRAQPFVESLCRHGDAVLFSAAVPGQGGTGHLNEQWQSYWKEMFAREGYQVFDLIRVQVWDDERVKPWYRQNTLLYARGHLADRLSKVQRPSMALDVVHPVLATRAKQLEARLADLEAEELVLRRQVEGLTQERNQGHAELAASHATLQATRAELDAFRSRLAIRLIDRSALARLWRRLRVHDGAFH